MKLLFALVLVCHAPGWSAEQPFAITVSPKRALMDDRVTIRAVGLPPDSALEIRVSTKDKNGRPWRSSAAFRSRHDGSIDLVAQAPVSGTYDGVDAMGLFWSMRPEGTTAATFPSADWSIADVEAHSQGRKLGATKVERRFAVPSVRMAAVTEEGIAGVLHRPADDTPRRAVLLLGGSEGGIPDPEGAMLASRGYVVLALAYFHAVGLPSTMQALPLEYFGRAIRYLQKLPFVKSGGVAIIGASRGAEAALMVASLYPEINAVIGVSSSHVRWEGSTASQLPGGPAWMWQGQALPYVRFHIGPTFGFRYLWGALTRNATPLRPMFLDSLHRDDSDAPQIAVERIRGPVLLACGTEDRLWPSCLMSERVMERLRRHGHPYADEHVRYEGAGHWLPAAYVPTGGLRGGLAAAIGGSPEATARVQADWWPRVLAFLSVSRGASLPEPYRTGP